MANALPAVSAAQGILTLVNPELRATGIWSTFSSEAYSKGSDTVRKAVDRILERNGLSASRLASEATLAKSTGANWVELSKVRGWVAEGAAILGLSSAMEEAVFGFVQLESPIRDGRVKITAVNGSSSGIMQMQPGAWTDASKVLARKGFALGPFDKGVFDGRLNTIAGVAYASINLRYVGSSPTATQLYLAHNQGGGFFTSGIVTNFDGQSDKVRAMIKAELKARGLKPKFRGPHKTY